MVNQSKAYLSENENSNQDALDLNFLFGLLKAHLWFIFFITALCVVLGGSYAFLRPAIYESSALIKVNQDSSSSASNMMAMLGMATGVSSSSLMNASPAEVQSSLIQSNYIMGEVCEKLGLNISITLSRFWFINTFLKRSSLSHDDQIHVSEFSLPSSFEGMPFELIRKNKTGDYFLYGLNHALILQGKVGVFAISEDQSIRLMIDSWPSNSSDDVYITKQPTNLVAQALLKNLKIEEQGNKTGILSIAYRSKEAAQSQQILDMILNVAVQANITEKAAEATKTLTFLKDQLPQITEDLNQSEASLNAYRSEVGMIDDSVEAELLLQEVVDLEKNLDELNLKKLEMLENFTAQHPYVIALDQKQTKIQARLDALKDRLKNLPLAAQKAENFLRDVKVHADIYSGIMQTTQQMEMLKGSTVSSIRILKPASFPAVPLSSNVLLILFVSFIFGFSCSLAILLLQYALSRKIDPLYLEKFLKVQVLAVIPYSLLQVQLFKEMRTKKTTRPHYLLYQDHPKDICIEALRSLRTALKLASLSDDKKIIAISGCSPSVGKSFVSSNLSGLLSDLGAKILLIDADMRKGYLHKIFSCPQNGGLSEYLEAKADWPSSIRSVLPNLDLMTAGDYPENPADLLMHQRFKQLMTEVSKQYELILIDTPPVLAVTDASLVFKFADIRLLLVSLSKDQLKEVEHAKGILEKSGLNLDGIICNSANQARKYGYKEDYLYHYHYKYN